MRCAVCLAVGSSTHSFWPLFLKFLANTGSQAILCLSVKQSARPGQLPRQTLLPLPGLNEKELTDCVQVCSYADNLHTSAVAGKALLLKCDPVTLESQIYLTDIFY